MAEIFVFGSNLFGIHGKGAALTALKNHGAIIGQGVGLQGNSYAIPTKENPHRTLDLVAINKYVADFLNFAYWTTDNTYNVTNIGCGLAGYDSTHIAPMFRLVKHEIHLPNVNLPQEFLDLLQT